MTNNPSHSAEGKLARFGPPTVDEREVPGIDEADAHLIALALKKLPTRYVKDFDARQRRLALLAKIDRAYHPFQRSEHDPDRCGARLPAPGTRMGWIWCGLALGQHVGDPVARFTKDQVADALNAAADAILDAAEAGDEGLRDGLNLLVNAGGSYLTGEAEDLEGVVEANYSAGYEEVLGWVRRAT